MPGGTAVWRQVGRGYRLTGLPPYHRPGGL